MSGSANASVSVSAKETAAYKNRSTSSAVFVSVCSLGCSTVHKRRIKHTQKLITECRRLPCLVVRLIHQIYSFAPQQSAFRLVRWQRRQKGWTGIIRESFGISFNGCFIVGEERQRDHNVDDYYSDDVNVVVTYHTAAGAAPHADQEAEKLDSSVVCHKPQPEQGGRDRDFQKWNDDCSNLEDFRFSVPRPSSSPSSSSSQS